MKRTSPNFLKIAVYIIIPASLIFVSCDKSDDPSTSTTQDEVTIAVDPTLFISAGLA